MSRVSVPRVHRCDSLQARSADVPTHPGFLESLPGAIVPGEIPPANPLRQVERLVPIFLPSKGPGARLQHLSLTATLVMEMKEIDAPTAMRQAKDIQAHGYIGNMPAHSIHMSDRIHTTFSLGLYLLVTPAPTTHLLSNTLVSLDLSLSTLPLTGFLTWPHSRSAPGPVAHRQMQRHGGYLALGTQGGCTCLEETSSRLPLPVQL